MYQLLEDIQARIEQLNNEYRDLRNKDTNHMASMILGEIAGLQWVLDVQSRS